jgi:plasmid stabilization system protein ParE
MAFRVEVSPEAFGDLDAIAAYIRRRGSYESAERWFNEIIDAIRALGEMPNRCPLAELSRELEAEVRLLSHGRSHRRYKIYFAVHTETEIVRVFHVRHWARKPADADEIEELMDK